MKVYLAGRMTGIPRMNFPAFDAAAKDLRARGFEVVSPAELDDPEDRERALASEDGDINKMGPGRSWGFFLARDVKLIADEGVEAIVVLPDWEKSRGARLETFVARLCEIPIVEYGPAPMYGISWGDLDVAHGPGLDFDVYADMEDPGPPLVPHEYANLIRQTNEEQARSCSKFLARAEGEMRVVNETTGGQKGTKAQRMELIPFDVLMRDVSPLYTNGSIKYEAHNWRRGYDWSLSFGAMMRHATAFWHGEDIDPEMQTPHMASVVFHALALLHFAYAYPELDDRPPVAIPA